jgi:hypothetical protein
MKIIEIKLSRYPDKIKGIVIQDGGQWIMINENEVDYILNGYRFINRKYVTDAKEIEKNSILYQILHLKYTQSSINIPLNNYEDLLSYIKEQDLLIDVGLESDSFMLVGRVGKIFTKSFLLYKIGVDAKDIGIENIKFSTIRYISIKTDYLDSLDLYLKSVKKADE